MARLLCQETLNHIEARVIKAADYADSGSGDLVRAQAIHRRNRWVTALVFPSQKYFVFGVCI